MVCGECGKVVGAGTKERLVFVQCGDCMQSTKQIGLHGRSQAS